MTSSEPVVDDGHARQARVFGRRHGQGLDVVATGREQAHDARQRAGFVLKQDCNDVFHEVDSSVRRPPRQR